MRKLKILRDRRSPISLLDINKFEEKYRLKFPVSLAEFIVQYEGSNTEECVYHNPVTSSFFPIHQFLYLWQATGKASVEAIYEGHLEDSEPKLIPFAIDQGGWDYSVSIDEKSYGTVWVNQWDSGEPEPYQQVADSLEEFIDKLINSDDAGKLGF